MSSHLVLAKHDEPVTVSASGQGVASELWFKTKPLETVFIHRAIRLQLVTDSHNQGEIVDEHLDEAWTWFELCILEDQHAKQPLVRDGKSLRWSSHVNRVSQSAVGETTRYYGAMFDRRHDLLDLLEVGNCIGIMACAQHAGRKNFAYKAALHATLIPDDMFKTSSWTLFSEATPDIPNGIPSGVYTIVPPHECHVVSDCLSDDPETSKLWFISPTFDADLISRLEDIRLLTTSYQNHTSISEEGVWSWFDLLIMENHDAKEPKVVDGRELIWMSHIIPYKHNEYSGQQGTLFTREDELLRYLKPGNVIGVRVCTAFEGWENHARTARLAIRMSNTGIPKKRIEPPPTVWAKINEQNQALANAMRKMLPDDVSSTELDLLTQNLRADRDYGCNKRPLRLLSLDGGGVRGVSELQILKVLFGNDGRVRPYKYFDMMCGTSTGGLVAIMLGRLHMTIDECLDAYKKLAEGIFGAGMVEKANDARVTGARYSGEKLKTAIQDIVKQYADDPEALMLDPREDGCKVFVVAVDSSNLNNKKATHLRTYYNDKVGDSMCGYKIWEAARATTAAPTYFPRMKLGKHDYVDGGLGYNNPILELVVESRLFFGRARCVDAIVTLGTGQIPNISFGKEGTGVKSSIAATARVGKALMDLASTSERAHLLAQDLLSVESYFRFNLGLKHWIEMVYPANTPSYAFWASKTEAVTRFKTDDWVEIGIALDAYDKIDELIKTTDKYLADTDTEKERIAKCYANIMKAGDLVGEVAVRA